MLGVLRSLSSANAIAAPPILHTDRAPEQSRRGKRAETRKIFTVLYMSEHVWHCPHSPMMNLMKSPRNIKWHASTGDPLCPIAQVRPSAVTSAHHRRRRFGTPRSFALWCRLHLPTWDNANSLVPHAMEGKRRRICPGSCFVAGTLQERAFLMIEKSRRRGAQRVGTCTLGRETNGKGCG